MFAILETGGKQYKIAEGDILEVELLPEELVKKNSASLTTVLLLQGDKDLHIGDPYVKNARVKAKVLEEIKADKIHIYKMKSKKGYRKSQGHRQKLHKIQIEKIEIKAPRQDQGDGIMAHKKSGGSAKNGRESTSKRLGVKKFGGEADQCRLHYRPPARHPHPPR